MSEPDVVEAPEKEISMEQRLRAAHDHFIEALTRLREIMKIGGVLLELPQEAGLHSLSDARTPLEGAVNMIETHHRLVQDLTREMVL